MKIFEEISDRIGELVDWHAISLDSYMLRRGMKHFTAAPAHTEDQERYLAEVTDVSYEINMFLIAEMLETEKLEESDLGAVNGLFEGNTINIFKPAYDFIRPFLKKDSKGVYNIKDTVGNRKEEILASYRADFDPNRETVLEDMLRFIDESARDYIISSQH